MKKVSGVIIAIILMFSLVGCSNSQTKNNESSAAANTTDSEQKEVTQFTDILDNLSNKDYFYMDDTGSTIKILDKDPFDAYRKKSDAIITKEMQSKNVDLKSAKTYVYYKNVNGDRSEKDYVVAYDTSKSPIAVYEVDIKISDKDEPSLKETKKLDKIINDNFKKLFKEELSGTNSEK